MSARRRPQAASKVLNAMQGEQVEMGDPEYGKWGGGDRSEVAAALRTERRALRRKLMSAQLLLPDLGLKASLCALEAVAAMKEVNETLGDSAARGTIERRAARAAASAERQI